VPVINISDHTNTTKSTSHHNPEPDESGSINFQLYSSHIRTAHQVSQRFNNKGAKYAGRMDESLSDKFQIYLTVANDYQLSEAQKLSLVHNLFEGDALRYYNSNVQGKAKSITDVHVEMLLEFNSITRQCRVKNQMRALRLNAIVETKQLTESEALDFIREKITTMLPQCPESFNNEAYKAELLRESVIGALWATEAIGRCSSNNSTFQELFQALHLALHQHEEE
jgi:hypothetical protein